MMSSYRRRRSLRLTGFFLLLVFTGNARAQQITSNVSYEGQRIATVDVVARPNLNIEPLRQKVAVHAGDTYSAAAVQSTVQALQGTGNFNKINFEVKPEAAGLRVTFIIEPAFYLGMVTFPGATKQFSYPRLLQVVNLPAEEPYEESRVAEAKIGLARFLQNNGFFQAAVDTELQLDEPHGLANVAFRVKLNRLAKIGTVSVTGADGAEKDHLERLLRSIHARVKGAYVKRGKPYVPKHLDASVGLIRDDLAKRQHPANQVKLNIEYERDTNRANLIFNVIEGPTVSVQVTGARLSLFPFYKNRTLRRLIPIYEEGAYDGDLVAEGKRNLTDHFQGRGYFDVKVDTQINEQPGNVSVVYSIQKNKRHRLVHVGFTGNTHYSNDDLRSHVEIRQAHWFSHGTFNDRLLGKSGKDLENFYRAAGYEHVKVTPKVADHEPQIEVTFEIVEGARSVVHALAVEGNSSLPAEVLDHSNDLAPGKPFSPQAMNAKRDRMLAAYLQTGYLEANVKARVDRRSDDPSQVDVTYSVHEGSQVYASEIVVLGENHTRRRTIERAIGLQPEQPISQAGLLQSESNLYDLGIFDWANVGIRKPITDQDRETVVARVHESKRNTLTLGFGLEVARRSGNIPSGTITLPGLPAIAIGSLQVVPSDKAFVSPRGTVEFTRRNLRGLGETGSLSARLARLDQRGLLSYTDPHFRGTRWSSLFSLSLERTSENPIFTAGLGEGSLQLQRFLDAGKTKTLILRYDFRRTVLTNLVIPELVLPQDRHVRLSTLSVSFLRDSRDKPLDAHRGVFQSIDFGLTPKALGSSANFVRFLGQTSYYKSLPLSLVWANNLRVGLAQPTSGSDVPLSERFFSGGATSLRGFASNSAGPQRLVPICANAAVRSTCTDIQVPVGGNQLLIVNSELRFPIPVKPGLGGVLFYDGGNVYERLGFRDIAKNYTNTVGIGIRYNTPVGPIRVDLARNLNPIIGVKSTQYFITVGQAF